MILALARRVVPTLAGLGEPVDGLTLPLARGGARPVHGAAGLSVTLGFGGFNTCLMFSGAPQVSR